MCGIAGIAFSKDADINIKKVEYFFKVLMMYTESRGSDATGYFMLDKNSNKIWYNKTNEPASDFVDRIDFTGQKPAYVVGHTRLSTSGDPKDNKNNHPIVYGKTIGVHNGVISNFVYNNILFRYNLIPNAEVDSEAGIMLINKFGHTNPELMNHIGQLTGVFCYTDINTPEELHIAISARELIIGQNKDKTVTVFASTKDIIQGALDFIEYKDLGDFFQDFEIETYYALEAHTRIIIKNGEILSETPFPKYKNSYISEKKDFVRKYNEFKIGDFVYIKNRKTEEDSCGEIVGFARRKKVIVKTMNDKILHTKIKNLIKCEDYEIEEGLANDNYEEHVSDDNYYDHKDGYYSENNDITPTYNDMYYEGSFDQYDMFNGIQKKSYVETMAVY